MNLIPWFLGPLAIFVWLLVEKYAFTRRFFLSARDTAIIKLEVISVALRLFLSLVVFFPLLGLLIPFNVWSFSNWEIHPILNFIICFLLVDFLHYLAHRIHHSIPLLWSFHRLHHSDKDVDVMTSWLHHPFEVISTYLLITFLYVVFDIPLEVIYAYSLVFILHVAFTHTKIVIPNNVDRWLRFLIVTPNAHRLHHSTDMREGNSNFGQLFLIWDIVFKTHINKSSLNISFGVQKEVSPRQLNLSEFLINPFERSSKL